MLAARVIIVFLTLMPLTGFAQTAKSQARQNACVNLIEQRAAAIVAEDWMELERLAERYVNSCKGVLDDYSLAAGYGDVAVANREMRNYEKSFTAAEACIRTLYSTTGCHLVKSEILMKWNRMTDARIALDKTEKLIKHMAGLNRAELNRGPSSFERELLEAKLNALDAQQGRISRLRDMYF